jgi:RNA polymerase sigma factor (sigma-70 family)
MATNQLRRVIHSLRTASLPHEEAGRTDGQLLESYILSREETAFTALVHRHGPMVWGVCRRVLRGHQDAEDAFQATFLVLVRKATSVRPRDMLANWLYGVAQRTALKARASAARLRAREKQVPAMPEPALEQKLWDDLQPRLDQELGRLPDKYRAVIVLCDLEGKTRKEAARHFRLPEGTVASRLATARTMLARRLARSGLAVSGGALGALLSQTAALAGPPASVVSGAIKAACFFAAGQVAAPGVVSVKAALLAEGVLRTMLLSKLKIATVVLVIVAAVSTGAAAFTLQRAVESPPGEHRPAALPDEKAADLASRERKRPERPAQKATAQPAKEEKENEPLPTLVSGIVKAVNAKSKTLTVSHRDGDSTFTVADNADINIDGKRGELAALPAGASIHLRQFVDARTTRSIQAEGRWFWGVVKGVDVVSSTITYGDRAQDGAAGKTFIVPKDLAISIDGKAGKLAEIPGGACANLQLFADQTTVRSLSVEGQQVNGIVKAVDAARRTITIDDKTYPVAADAHVGIDHRPGKLEEVLPGANVGLNLCVDQKTVLRISGTGSSDFGQVKAVDSANSTITVTGGPPNDRVYNVPPDAPITIDGQPGKMAAIPVGAGLHALNLRVDQKTVSSINVVGPSYHHVGVKAVDPDGRTITFDDKAPATIAGKTLVVAADAGVEVDGKPGRLAGIPAGAFVNVGLSVDAQTARHIQAEGPNLGGCGGSECATVDAVNNTITFAAGGAAEVAGKTFNVAKDIWIQIDARPGKLAEIPAGSYLNITLTVDQQLVRGIWAVGPPVPGTGVVKAVDAEKRTITVDDRTYPVAQNANIIIANRGGLAAVPVGATVSLRLCVDQKTVGTINVVTK